MGTDRTVCCAKINTYKVVHNYTFLKVKAQKTRTLNYVRAPIMITLSHIQEIMHRIKEIKSDWSSGFSTCHSLGLHLIALQDEMAAFECYEKAVQFCILMS